MLNFRKIIALTAAVLTVSAFPVSGAEPAGENIIITDMIGRELDVTPGSYSRVVCIGAGALRMYTYICGSEYLCGVEDIDNTSLEDRPKMFDSAARPYIIAYGNDFTELPSCGVGGPNAQTAEAEMILSCNPDIVISFYQDVEKEDALQSQLGVPVVTLMSGPGGVFDERFKDSLRLLGTLFEREARAEELIFFINAESDEISSRTSDIPEDTKPSVYICGLGNWGTASHLTTAQNYNVFDIAHIKNVVQGLEGGMLQTIEEEKFVSLGGEMDIMIMDAAAVKNIAASYSGDNTMFDVCKAWNNNEVYMEMAYNAYYTNYEIALANAWFAGKCVYPELFNDIDMTDKTDKITEMFLGQPLADEIFAYPTSFGGYGKVAAGDIFR
ncbi:MAG: ABC transporter substrate-binding protein [Parasporobacterium sp.]|nr:ABC transporter substrate-binding protein [Parasporobacterium sp.]